MTAGGVIPFEESLYRVHPTIRSFQNAGRNIATSNVSNKSQSSKRKSKVQNKKGKDLKIVTISPVDLDNTEQLIQEISSNDSEARIGNPTSNLLSDRHGRAYKWSRGKFATSHCNDILNV